MSGLTPIDRLCLQRGAAHLHCLGPRAYAELFEEVGAETGTMQLILARLNNYRRITPEMLRATGGDRFPLRLRVISR